MKPKLSTARPSTTRKIAQLTDGSARLVVALPRSVHKRLRIDALEKGTTVRELIFTLLRKAGYVDTSH